MQYFTTPHTKWLYVIILWRKSSTAPWIPYPTICDPLYNPTERLPIPLYWFYYTTDLSLPLRSPNDLLGTQ